MPSRTVSIILFLAAALLSLVAIFLWGPIPQDPAYHEFAGQLPQPDPTALSLPWNLSLIWNVASNAIYAIVGIGGFLFVGRYSPRLFTQKSETLLWGGIFLGILLVAGTSTWYHLHPSNARLVGDRFAIAWVASFLLGVIMVERLGNLGLYLAILLIAAALLSPFQWYWSEVSGKGDLRFYGWVQFFPLLGIPILCWLFPKPGTLWLMIAIGWYLISKIFEVFDQSIWDASQWIGGHPLKHLTTALGGAALILYLRARLLKTEE